VDHSTFSKNGTLIESGVARRIMKRLLKRAKRERLSRREHFSVDGRAGGLGGGEGMRRRDGRMNRPSWRNPSVDFHGQNAATTRMSPGRSRSTAGPQGTPTGQALLPGHVLMEHRNGLVVDVSQHCQWYRRA